MVVIGRVCPTFIFCSIGLLFDCIGILFKYRGDDYYWSLDVDQGFIECNYNVCT